MSQGHDERAQQLLADGRFSAVVELLEPVVSSGQATVRSYVCLAEALKQQKECARSVHFFRKALQLDPDSPVLHNNISAPLNQLGEAHLAAQHLEIAVAGMRDLDALRNLAVLAPGVPGYSQRRLYEVRRAFGRALAMPGFKPSRALRSSVDFPSGPLHQPPRPPLPRGRPLHIAYLSAHFGRPAYMGPVWALINNHDRTRFRISMLSDAAVDGPFPGYRDHDNDLIADVRGASDEYLEKLIADLEVDVLIDLSAYSFTPRLSLFARRVAPVVASWFNMYATSGLPGVDYLIGDAETVYVGEEGGYTETVQRLPQSYLSYQPFEGRPPVGPARGADQPFTFGSLVSLYKVTKPVRDAWAQILNAAPESRLLLANAHLKSPENRAWLTREFTDRGIDASRILYRDPAPHDRFLRYYEEIDLALDAFPYSGGTTTMEALWQGVPVLTQVSGGWPARTTASILRDAGLADYICADIEHYTARAAELAGDPGTPAMLAALRSTLRDTLRASTICDGGSLAAAMEALYVSFFEA